MNSFLKVDPFLPFVKIQTENWRLKIRELESTESGVPKVDKSVSLASGAYSPHWVDAEET